MTSTPTSKKCHHHKVTNLQNLVTKITVAESTLKIKNDKNQTAKMSPSSNLLEHKKVKGH